MPPVDNCVCFRATAPDGKPIAEAVLRATRGSRTVTAYSESDGDYRLGADLSTSSDLMGEFAVKLPRARDVPLDTALESTPTIRRKTIVIRRAACLFVDGIPRPGVPVDAILAGDVEFVEVYPPGSELTRTLQQAWPLGAACGVRDNSAMRYGNSRQTAQFISVWQRVP